MTATEHVLSYIRMSSTDDIPEIEQNLAQDAGLSPRDVQEAIETLLAERKIIRRTDGSLRLPRGIENEVIV